MNIIYNLKNPGRALNKILLVFENFILSRKYNLELYERKQNEIFNSLNFDRRESLQKLIDLKKNINYPVREMSSEHEIIFSAIASKKKVNKILEIGTFDGWNSYLLSKLFPSSQIVTLDLDEKDRNFSKFYNRQDKLNDFILERNKILKKSDNIVFRKTNSINMINFKEKYDLIWIDGAHGYPVATIDIVNALNLVEKEGIILCDDVFIQRPINEDKMYSSLASYETLKSFEEQKIIKLFLFYKRLSKKFNLNPKTRQYIGLVKPLN